MYLAALNTLMPTLNLISLWQFILLEQGDTWAILTFELLFMFSLLLPYIRLKINNALVKLILYLEMLFTLPGTHAPAGFQRSVACENTYKFVLIDGGIFVELLSKIQVVIDITPPRVVKNYRHFHKPYCLHLKRR